MKKYIYILFAICIFLVGCSQQANITKEVIDKNDSQEVAMAKTIKNKLLEYKNKNVFIINTVSVNDDIAENAMIRKNGKEVYIESDSSEIMYYNNGVNYLYDTSNSEVVKLSDLNPEHKNEDIINPFIDKYINVLDWNIQNKDAFSVKIEENKENGSFFKVYTFTGEDNEWLKEQYDKAYGLFDFWKDTEMVFEIQYVFDKDDNLIQYFWKISDKDNKNILNTEGKLGRDLAIAYSQIGYDLNSFFEGM